MHFANHHISCAGYRQYDLGPKQFTIIHVCYNPPVLLHVKKLTIIKSVLCNTIQSLFLSFNSEIYLAIAIGLSLVAVIITLLSIYCCERYKKNKKLRRFRKQQARLGAPQAAQDGDYDDVDYSRAEAWNMNGHSKC